MRAAVLTAVLAAVLGLVGLATARPASAGPLGSLGAAAGRGIDEAIDVGPEASVLGSFASGGTAAAVGVDLVFAIYVDDAVALEASLPDRILGRTPRRRWPFLSHPALSIHVGGVFDAEADRSQVHLAVGSGLGPVGIALAAVREVQPDSNAWGLGPELRLRHRFGPSRDTLSVGLLVRAEIFAQERETHPDRITFGAFVMWGW